MSADTKDRKIGEWMKIFSRVYADVDHGRSPEQIWIGVTAHCSKIGEAIRKIHSGDIMYFAAHAFCWLCSYVNRCNELTDDVFFSSECLSGMVSFKYPQVCGLCRDSPCVCEPEKTEKKKDKAADYEKLLRLREKTHFNAFTIAMWQETFGEVYRRQVPLLTLDTIGFHFLEEVGEAALAVRQLSQLKKILDREIPGIDRNYLQQLSTVPGVVENYQRHHKEKIVYGSKEPAMLKARLSDAKVSMMIEIADTFSWFCSILNKLATISKNCDFKLDSLEVVLDSQYFNADGDPWCPTCENSPCTCVFFC